MEYSLQSNRLVALHEDTGTAPWYSAVTALDLAAGGRMLCRSSASVCALQPTAPCAAHGCVTAGYPRAALRREKYGIVAFTLLDGGSGNEVVTGCVRNGKSILA